MPCTTYKTLTLTFTEPVIPPVNGYFVKWRVVGTNTWNIIPNQFSSPIIITGVPDCDSIEGTIQADCGDDNFGSSIPFSITVAPKCYQYKMLGSGSLTFTACDSSDSTTVTVAADDIICAKPGSLSGVAYTSLEAQCLL